MQVAQSPAYDPVLLGLAAVVMGLIGNSLLEWLKHSLQTRRAIGVVRKTIYIDVLRYIKLIEPETDAVQNLPAGQDFSLIFITEIPNDRLITLSAGQLSSSEVFKLTEFYMKLNVMCNFCHQWGKFDSEVKNISHVHLPATALPFLKKSLPNLLIEAIEARDELGRHL
jgi:hypothetical protein